jgi:hypothetical protein
VDGTVGKTVALESAKSVMASFGLLIPMVPTYESKFILDSFLLRVCPAKFLRSPAANIDFFARLHIL